MRFLILPFFSNILSKQIPIKTVRCGYVTSSIHGSEQKNVEGNRHGKVNNGVDGVKLLNKDIEGWKEHSASDSEAIVKAEKFSKNQSTESLQNETSKHFQKVYHENEKVLDIDSVKNKLEKNLGMNLVKSNIPNFLNLSDLLDDTKTDKVEKYEKDQDKKFYKK